MNCCEEEIILDIKKNLQDISKEYTAAGTNFKKIGGSFIQASKTKNNIKKSYQKAQNEHISKSKIIQRNNKYSLDKSKNLPLQPIVE